MGRCADDGGQQLWASQGLLESWDSTTWVLQTAGDLGDGLSVVPALTDCFETDSSAVAKPQEASECPWRGEHEGWWPPDLRQPGAPPEHSLWIEGSTVLSLPLLEPWQPG